MACEWILQDSARTTFKVLFHANMWEGVSPYLFPLSDVRYTQSVAWKQERATTNGATGTPVIRSQDNVVNVSTVSPDTNPNNHGSQGTAAQDFDDPVMAQEKHHELDRMDCEPNVVQKEMDIAVGQGERGLGIFDFEPEVAGADPRSDMEIDTTVQQENASKWYRNPKVGDADNSIPNVPDTAQNTDTDESEPDLPAPRVANRPTNNSASRFEIMRELNPNVDTTRAVKNEPDNTKLTIQLAFLDGRVKLFKFSHPVDWTKTLTGLNAWRRETFRRTLGVPSGALKCYRFHKWEKKYLLQAHAMHKRIMEAEGYPVDWHEFPWDLLTRKFNDKFQGKMLPGSEQSRPARSKQALRAACRSIKEISDLTGVPC